MDKVKLPRLFEASDYHDIAMVNRFLAGTGIKAKEVGFDGYSYIGLFYTGNLKDINLTDLAHSQRWHLEGVKFNESVA